MPSSQAVVVNCLNIYPQPAAHPAKRGGVLVITPSRAQTGGALRRRRANQSVVCCGGILTSRAPGWCSSLLFRSSGPCGRRKAPPNAPNSRLVGLLDSLKNLPRQQPLPSATHQALTLLARKKLVRDKLVAVRAPSATTAMRIRQHGSLLRKLWDVYDLYYLW
ncbi:hypothetical protein BX600DRAFT_522149 [Xylariales sp. PMI_506]|nr:hypothetical protein BX600DRAFT_522149 [Xylariales sp. PMI_506]